MSSKQPKPVIRKAPYLVRGTINTYRGPVSGLVAAWLVEYDGTTYGPYSPKWEAEGIVRVLRAGFDLAKFTPREIMTIAHELKHNPSSSRVLQEARNR